MSSDRKLTVILGAGASYDCIAPNTASKRDNYRPPLTKDLFSLNPDFDPILARFPGAMALSPDIRNRLRGRKTSESLEEILEEYIAA